jgi:hypothetical protein
MQTLDDLTAALDDFEVACRNRLHALQRLTDVYDQLVHKDVSYHDEDVERLVGRAVER